MSRHAYRSPPPERTFQAAQRLSIWVRPFYFDHSAPHCRLLADAVPGPCQFCAGIGAPYHLDPSRRKQRPYYQASKEEIQYLILEHFVLDTDLNLHTLNCR